MQHHPNHRRHSINHPPRLHRSIFRFILILAVFAVATPALADYLGPNRVVTQTGSACKVVLYECQYVPSKNDYRYHKVEEWSCSNEAKPWQAYPNQPSSQGCFDATAGDQYWDKVETVQEVTVTYPPATINGSLQNCTLSNGWCTTPARLSLTASEPVQGYSILAIEGTLNGQTFACSGANCSIPLNEGSNNFTYWALSSWGDSSTMGTLTAKVDSQPPSITGSLTGTPGANNWYISPVTFTGSAADATSGVASFTCTLDGAPLASCNPINVNTDGPHTLVLTARDRAGQTATLSRNASLDTQNPVLSAAISGTEGSNNWYTAASLSASASDPSPGSGLAAFEYNLDAAGWIPFPASGVLDLPQGKHSLDLRAADSAGRAVSSARSFWLDSVAPQVAIDPAGTSGSNGWYTSSLILAASASDATSGLDLFEYSLDNGAWTAYTTPLTLADGTHSLSFWAQDFAGLVTQVDRTYKVDTRPPQISGSLSGVPGANGWYTSEVRLSASAADPAPGSGIDAFTYILDGGPETSYTDALTLSDGRHTLQFDAEDEAGLAYSTQQVINVDTIPPSLSVHTTLPEWIRNSLSLNGSAADGGSGLSKVEISIDGGQTWQPVTGSTAWGYIWNTQSDSNGIHDVHVRAIDHAGLATRHTFRVGVDNRPPKINIPESWYQWDTIELDIWDEDSGLAEARIEISDPEGRWPARIIRLDPGRFPLDFKWDRRFGDDTVAPLGTYSVKVVAFDELGNSTRKNASINILLGILPPGPTATLQPNTRPTPAPDSAQTLVPTPVLPTQTAVVSTFGVVQPTVEATPFVQALATPRTPPAQTNVLDWLESIFTPNSSGTESVTEVTSSSLPSTSQSSASSSDVLWGAAAAAVIGSATAYALEGKRKREDEQARQAAQVRAEVEAKNAANQASRRAKWEALKVQNWLEGQATLNAHIEGLKRQGASAKQIEALKHTGATQGLGAAIDSAVHLAGSLYRSIVRQDARTARREERVEAEAKFHRAEPGEWQTAYNKYMQEKAVENWRRGEQEYYPAAEKQAWGENAVDGTKDTSDKVWHWLDEHQTEIVLGFGVAVGIAAIVLSGGVAAPAVAAAWAAGAAVVAAGTVAAGTIALNVHYGREWNENLGKNIAVGTIAAAAVTGGWFAFQALTTAVGGYCAVNQAICTRVETVFKAWDTVEELWLQGKLTYQTWRGDEAGARETAFELQTEYVDGGMPGNSVADELRDQLSKLNEDTLHLVETYGDDVISLLVRYGDGDEVIDIIGAYGDEGIAILQKYGDEAIKLIGKHGTPAVELMKMVDPEKAEKLLTALDDDVLDYALEQGPDAVAALSLWKAEDLSEHGLELALRAKKDAEVLANVKKLISLRPIDPKHLTQEQQALIKAIAANSTQYADEGQVVLGKWFDIDSGFVEVAQDTGSVHYNPHPEMWNLLGNLGKENQEEVAWLINKQVVQTGIDKGLPFEYTLNDIPADVISNEHAAVRAIFSGKSDADIMRILESSYMPIRMKELQELHKAGYELAFDEVTNSYILFLP